MTTTRDLIQRLADLADALDGRKPLVFAQGQSMDGFTALANFQSLANEARTYLSQPEPEGLTDEEIADEARKYLVNEYALPADITFLLDPDNFQYKPTIGCFRAVIAADRARCGRPKPPSLKSSSHL